MYKTKPNRNHKIHVLNTPNMITKNTVKKIHPSETFFTDEHTDKSISTLDKETKSLSDDNEPSIDK